MGQLKQLAGQTVIYGASSVLGKALNYFLVPLYTAVFTPGAYGIVTELYAFVAFLNVFYTYGFETAYIRFSTKSGASRGHFDIATGSLIMSSALFSGLLIVFSVDISMALQYPGQERYIIWLALVLGIDAIVAVSFARLRLEGKAVKFAALKLGNIALNIFLNLFFLIFCPFWLGLHPDSWIRYIYPEGLGVGYVFLSNLIANLFYIFPFADWLFKIRIRFGEEWRSMLKYAWPLLLMGFAGVTNEMLSRVLLKYWLPAGFYPGYSNQYILGIFGACYKLSVFMTLAAQAFKYAFEPFFFTKHKDRSSAKFFAAAMHGFVIFGSFSWLVISLFLPDIAHIFLRRDNYLIALDIVPWLLGGGLFLGVYFNLSVWYKLTDKTIFGAWMAIFGALVTIAGNMSLIPILGYLGCAIASFISYFAMMVVSYFLGQKYYHVPYYAGKGVFYLLLAGLFILVAYFWDWDYVPKYFISVGSIAVFLFFVWWLDIRTGTFFKKQTI